MAVYFWNQSAYSLLHSTCRLQELVAFAKTDGQQALGICDRNVLSGVVKFYQLCQKAGIKPLIGMSVVEAEQELSLIHI